jgi:phosphate/sulfate permease
MDKFATVLGWIIAEIVFLPITIIAWAFSPLMALCVAVIPLVIMLITDSEEKRKQEELDRCIDAMVDGKISPEQFTAYHSQRRR